MFKWVTRICLGSMAALLLTLFAPSYAHADVWEYTLFQELYGNINSSQWHTRGSFEITGGLTNDVEFTFDTIRVLVGSALDGTEITIRIFEYTEDGSFSRLFEDSLTVGASGVFSKRIDLELGQNFILLSAEEEYGTSVFTALIVRKDIEIQHELVQGIVLPGEIHPDTWRTQR